MRFIQENIFLLSTIGVAVLIGGLMLAWSAGIGGDVDEALASRQKLSNQLSRLRKPPVNVNIVEAEREGVEEVLVTQQTVVDMCVEWNCRNYQTFELRFDTEDGKRVVPAFPADRQLYRRYDLTFNAAQVYRKELAALLVSLRPVVPPTKEQIDDEKDLWEKKLHDEWRERKNKRRKAAEAAEGDEESIAETAKPKPVAGGVDKAEPAPTAQKALERAEIALLIKHAKEATIYAPSKALDWVLPGPELVAPPITKIWQAQLNYWITKDIIAAIRATNAVSARPANAGNEIPSVLDAAVKELVKVEIDENYVAGPEAAGGTTGIARRGVEAAVNSFTQRASCQQYDVLHYSFTVVMPTRSLNALERNLMKRNYHTILGVHIRQLPQRPSDRYYGTDPVMAVTIRGELLVLTAWKRALLGELEKETIQRGGPSDS